ncbi:hypothetical protein ATANTOWER_017068, partial [Ataeniobius toweri]|nr:hypothetical protein [Ataeniobius toweri]
LGTPTALNLSLENKGFWTTEEQPNSSSPWPRVVWELVPISSALWARGKVHPGQVASPSQGNTEMHRTNNHAHTYSHLRANEKYQLT